MFPNIATERTPMFWVLGCLRAVIDARRRGPPVVYLLIYTRLANVSTKKEAIYPPTQHIVVATVTQVWHRSHGHDYM